MNEQTVKKTLLDLMARVESLQAENAALRERNVACAKAMERLVAKVEDLQAAHAELKLTERRTMYRQRPLVMRGRTVQANVGCGPLYITLNEDESGRPFEVFFKLGKSGSCQQSYLEALGVAMSVGLRYGADPQKFVEKFEGMRCPNPKMRDGVGPTTLSCADGISQGLAKALALALPGTDPEVRHEADVIAVAEPKFTFSMQETAEDDANAKSIDLIGNSRRNGKHDDGGGQMMPSLSSMMTLPSVNVRKAMMSGVGMCPKCGGNLISQGGCVQCLQDCGYVGKCS